METRKTAKRKYKPATLLRATHEMVQANGDFLLYFFVFMSRTGRKSRETSISMIQSS